MTDIFGLLMNEEAESSPTQANDIVYMLKDSLNRFGFPDIGYIADGASVSVTQAIDALEGAIFQSPEYFENRDSYSAVEGWLFAPGYLSGNIASKLETARRMNKRFSGRFDKNIDALEKLMPPDMDIDDIHIGFGATWIPTAEYEEFVKDLLHLSGKQGKRVRVIFNKELAKYKVISTPEADDSVINTYTYGVRGEKMGIFGLSDKLYLTAIDIIERTLNAHTIKVYDYVPSDTSKSGYDAIFNKEKTVEAQEKQSAILFAFNEWVHETPMREARFKKYYNEEFPCYVYPQYDGAFLTLPDINPSIKLYTHQRNSIARILFSDSNILLAQKVGAGKTYEMVIAVHEMKRMHISEKNLVVVPNNVLKATVDAHRLLYKDDKILVVYPKDFTKEHRNGILEQIRDGDYVAIYMAHSSFDLIVMSKNYYADKLSAEISELRAAMFDCASKPEKVMLDSQINKLSKKLSEFMKERTDSPWLSYEKLGITTLVIDEFHNYKNAPIQTRSDGLVGMHKKGSAKCAEMLEKVHSTKRVIAATGTPLTNSMADLFTLQTYLQPEVLAFHNIKSLDIWLNTFAKRETCIECTVDTNAQALRTVTRFTSFHNLGELMALFSQVCIFEGTDNGEISLPDYEVIDVCTPKSAAQAEYFRLLSERIEKIHRGKTDRNEDNMLKVSIDGMKAALDIRLTERADLYSVGETGKIAKCAQNIIELYRSHPDTAQIVFSDIGTPKADRFNVYDCLKEMLTEMGIPEFEIAFVHDAVTEAQRDKLFKAVNKGLIRVIIGSTQKLGVGVNLQERLIALHDLSVPYRPADLEQRHGRIVRAGNTCKKVFLFRYICEGTFDSFSFQLLENKQRFISSFLCGTAKDRKIDGDIGEAVLTYAEAKALAIGNPLVRTRFEIYNALERKKTACRARQRQLFALKGVIESAPARIKRLKEASDTAFEDNIHYRKSKRPVASEDRIAFGEELLLALKENVLYPKERLFDIYQGFEIILPKDMTDGYPYIIVKRKGGGTYRCDLDSDKTPLGCNKTVDYLLEHLEERAEKYLTEIADIEKQMAEARRDIESENPYTAEVEALTSRLAEIDEQLSGAEDKKVS